MYGDEDVLGRVRVFVGAFFYEGELWRGLRSVWMGSSFFRVLWGGGVASLQAGRVGATPQVKDM